MIFKNYKKYNSINTSLAESKRHELQGLNYSKSLTRIDWMPWTYT